MSLEDAIARKSIKSMPYSKEFARLKARLDSDELEAIVAELTRRLNVVPIGKSISASWIPGNDWEGTVFQPIYTKVCRKNFDTAALFFGNMMKWVVINHESLWRSVKQPKKPSDPDSIETTLYWRVD